MRTGCLIITLALAGCSQFSEEARAIEKAESAVADKLKDPESAQFRNVEPCPDNPIWYTGEVNGKNSFGAYAGFERFYSLGPVAYLESETDGALGWLAGDAVINCKGSTLTLQTKDALLAGMPENLKRERLEETSAP
jgi:hypothetical protein